MSAPKAQHVVVGFFLHPYLDLFCGRAGPHLARLLPAHPLAHAHQALQARSAPLHEGPAGKVELVLVPVGQRSEVGKARRLALKCRSESSELATAAASKGPRSTPRICKLSSTKRAATCPGPKMRRCADDKLQLKEQPQKNVQLANLPERDPQ